MQKNSDQFEQLGTKIDPAMAEVMSGTMIDYEACAVDDTKIIDVFEFGKADSDTDGKHKAAGE